MSYKLIAREQLVRHEGYREHPYYDTEGVLTIGIGRNLQKGLSREEVYFLFENDLKEAETTARKLVAVFDQLSDNRKAVILNLAFNLGETRLSKFVKTLAAINGLRYEEAAKELRNSLWYRQVGNRAKELIKLWRKG